MAATPPARTPKTTFSLEVDRLLKQIPGRGRGIDDEDPVARRDPPPAARPSTSPRASGAFAQATLALGAVGPRLLDPVPSVRAQHITAWLGALAALGLAASVSEWPYARECGANLYLYLAVVAVVQITAGWASVASWRVRCAGAHAVALIAAFSGIVLAAEQILARIGYSADAATWACLR